MTPIFLHPFGLITLAGLPLLAAIYLLRSRFRRVPVSSLFLWLGQRTPREGGARFQRLQTPLLFFLEAAAITLLAAAAGGPRLPRESSSLELAVVLDDSISMLAGGEDSPRRRAREDLRAELERRRAAVIRFVLAGVRPEALGQPARSRAEADLLLDEWECLSPTAALEDGIALAAALGGPQARILVVTDRAPPGSLEEGRVEWWARGRPAPNLAILGAARAADDGGGERLAVEVGNLAPAPARAALRLRAEGEAAPGGREALELGPGESRRLLVPLAAGTAALRVEIEAAGGAAADALAADSGAVLLPPDRLLVTARLETGDEKLAGLARAGLTATRRARLAGGAADLVVTDRATGLALAGPGWVLELLAEEGAASFTGPFVIDRAHPLAEGLSLAGVIWGSGRGDLPGRPVIAAGNTPLLTDTELAGGRHHLRLRLAPGISTLQETPAWPVLFHNLVEWRAAEAPGVRQPNVRAGATAAVVVGRDTPTARVTDPGGRVREAVVEDGRVLVEARRAGVYRVAAAGTEHALAANVFDREESDLRGATTGRWGSWRDDAALRRDTTDVSWAAILAALALLAVHSSIVARRRGGDRR